MLSAATTYPLPNPETLPEISRSVLRVLLYFRIFHYPITREELFSYTASGNILETQATLAQLIRDGFVQSKGEYVWVNNDDKIISSRISGNIRAEKFLKTARRHARLLSWFPFINSICISGSLSKLYMDDHSDIDYFIITNKRRLWLTKLLMSAIVETLEVLGLQKYFCPNYIITEDNLSITDRNIYTAMEIITLIPLYNYKGYTDFLEANEWVRMYFPNYRQNLSANILSQGKKPLRSFFGSRFFTWLDTRVFRFYKKRFAAKVKAGKIVAIENDMVITENNFKLHLSGHRHRILQQYQEQIWQFEEHYGITL